MDYKNNKSEIMIGIIIVAVFLLVGFLSKANTFSKEVVTSPSGFTDTGQICTIDNVKFDVIVDNHTQIVYLMSPADDILTVLYSKNLKPLTLKQYNSR